MIQRSHILSFLHAIDEELARIVPEGTTLNLYLIGRSPLIIRYGVGLATSDVDFVWLLGSSELESKALDLFGKDTRNALDWGLYLQEVPQGLPPIPTGYDKRSVDIPGNWRVLRPKYPDPNDHAVTKLKRFHAKDRQDIQGMCDRGDLQEDRLRAALNSAFMWAADEEEDPGRKDAYENLERVIKYLQGKSSTL